MNNVRDAVQTSIINHLKRISSVSQGSCLAAASCNFIRSSLVMIDVTNIIRPSKRPPSYNL